MNFEIAINQSFLCGEAPIWDPQLGRLVWTDIPANTVWEHRPGSNAPRLIHDGCQVSGIALNRNGSLLFAGCAGLHLWENGVARLLAHEVQEQPLCFNDVLASPTGNLYAGTIHWGASGMERLGALYLIRNSQIEMVDEGIELANGLALSPDTRTLYFTDSAKHTIYAYERDPLNDTLRTRRVFCSLTMEDGLPDGITVDSEGFVWCALWYGGQVLRIDPDGKVERRICLPAKQLSSVAFGGPALDELFVTSAADPWPSSYQPSSLDLGRDFLGGPIYRVRAGVQGRAEFVGSFAL